MICLYFNKRYQDKSEKDDKMKIGAIIQARMGSKRLPKKVLRILIDKPVLEHIINRVKKSKYCETIIVATTISQEDDAIANFLKKISIPCFRGSQHNVLERFYECAKQNNLDLIIRVTADDPFKDPLIIDRAVKIMLKNPSLDYCSNTIIPTFPEGIDIEVFTFKALEKTYREATLYSEKEHVTPYMWKNPHKFKIYNFVHNQDLSHWRWTLDTEDDWKFVQIVYKNLYNNKHIFCMSEIVTFLKKNPQLIKINTSTKRNEGYFESLKKDREE